MSTRRLVPMFGIVTAILLTLCGALLVPATIGAQSATSVDTLSEARRLRDARDFSAAAVLMRPYVESHPDDPGSARFAALMAYWSGDRANADSIYSRALTHHPRDPELRLEYAQFLLETQRTGRVRQIVEPIVIADSGFTATQVGRAHTLLGTADYWSGDHVAGRRELVAALRSDSSIADARQRLTEIETASASWIRIGSSFWDDDQPFRHLTSEAEAGWFVNPLSPLIVRAGSALLDATRGTKSITSVQAMLGSYFPTLHTDVGAGAGLLQRSFGESTDWIGHASLGFRLPKDVSIRAKFERAPYSRTARSLSTAVMAQSIEGGVSWGTRRAWLGEALARRETYGDDNAVSTAYAWMLAPLIRNQGGTFHVGYSFAAQSSNESRFVPRGDGDIPPGRAGPVLGEYNPYHTPKNLRAHSALVAASVHPNGRWSLDADARYALTAHDDAPVLVAVATPPGVTVTRGFYDRSFTPWNARALVGVRATESVRLGFTAEHGQSAYYAFTTAGVQLTYTFIAAARRRAAVH